jgi:hypothetical protein
MDPSGGGIIVVGSAGDGIVFVDGEQWRMAAPTSVAGFSFSRVTLSDTFVQVDFVSPWQNLAQPSDVNNDGSVTAGDALRIINELSRRAFSDPDSLELNDPSSVSPWPNVYFDQNGDRLASALDALRVINEIARQSNNGAAGEAEAVATPPAGRSTADGNDVAPPAPPAVNQMRRETRSRLVTVSTDDVGRSNIPVSRADPQLGGSSRDADRQSLVDRLLADSQFIRGLDPRGVMASLEYATRRR